MTEPQNGGALALRLHRKMLGAGVPPHGTTITILRYLDNQGRPDHG
jgi:hypothetical protein